jgi:hypothetical protein
MLLIMALWAAIGTGFVNVPGEITGATIAIATMIAQFYFRKAAPDSAASPPTP